MSVADRDHMKVFAGRAGLQLATAMCDAMDIPLGAARTELFPDSELHVKVEEDVRGRDCFVIQSTYHPVNAHLMELLIYIDCLKRASAQRITAVIPYFGYARQDRKEEGRVPITAKLVANLITAAGADRVLTIDLHAAQIQGFFDIPVDHLSAAPVFAEHFRDLREELGDLVLVSPDVGNVKVANMYASLLDADLAIIDKRRESGMKVASKNLIGSVDGRTVLMVDDIISTAGTVCEGAKLVKEGGATDVVVACTHAVNLIDGVDGADAGSGELIQLADAVLWSKGSEDQPCFCFRKSCLTEAHVAGNILTIEATAPAADVNKGFYIDLDTGATFVAESSVATEAWVVHNGIDLKLDHPNINPGRPGNHGAAGLDLHLESIVHDINRMTPRLARQRAAGLRPGYAKPPPASNLVR